MEEDTKRQRVTTSSGSSDGGMDEKQLEAHILVNVAELSQSRLFVGPFITERTSALKLSNQLGITHVVNMCPTTTAETKSGKPRDTWYTCYWVKCKNEPIMVREPLSADFAVQSDVNKRRYYLEATRRVVNQLDSNSRIYVHHQTGRVEECILACALWAAWQPATFVGTDALVEWLQHQNFLWMLDDPADVQMMLDVVGKVVEEQKRNTVSKYFARVPKKKNV